MYKSSRLSLMYVRTDLQLEQTLEPPESLMGNFNIRGKNIKFF